MEFFGWSDYSADKCTIRITDEMDMTPLQVSCWRGKFLRWPPSGTPSTIFYTRWSSRRYEIGCDAPMPTSNLASAFIDTELIFTCVSFFHGGVVTNPVGEYFYRSQIPTAKLSFWYQISEFDHPPPCIARHANRQVGGTHEHGDTTI